MKEKFRRRNYFIQKTFQGKYIFNFYILVIIGAIIFTAIFSYVTVDTLTVTYENYNLKLDRTPLMLFKQMLTANWVIFIPVGLIVIIAAIFQSHRIAGPLFKIERVIDEMCQGIIHTDLYLRQKDEGKEVMDKLKEYNIFLASKITAIRALSQEIGQGLDNGEQPGIDNAKQAAAKLDAILNEFTIKE